MSKKMLFSLLLVIFLIALQVNLWTGQGGLLQFWQLKQAISHQEDENAQLEARNSSLHAEVLDLKEGHAAIEERARSELGMIKPGEKFYQIMDEDDER